MKHITTHNHAPAPYHQLDQLALARAADCEDTDNTTQVWRNERCEQLESDKKKLEQQLKDAERQAELDRRHAISVQSNLEYQLHKAEDERAACVLVILLIVVAAVMTTCGVAV